MTKNNIGGYDNIEYKVLDIQEIPYENATFDVVIANMMLYHVPDILLKKFYLKSHIHFEA